jgi:hypothetical protein
VSTSGDTATTVQPPMPSGAGALPAVWPSAWPSLWPAVVRRAAFVAAVDLLTLVGLAVAADPATQWWALLPPLLLLAGPLTAPARTRHRAAAAAARLDLRPDGVVLIRRRTGSWRPFARITPGGAVHYRP